MVGRAKAFGIEDKIGTLEPGKQADIAIISLANVAQQPVKDVHSALVFASNARDVVMTMVAGAEIYGDGRPMNVDEDEIRDSLKDIRAKLS